jgi:hypothetical protein
LEKNDVLRNKVIFFIRLPFDHYFNCEEGIHGKVKSFNDIAKTEGLTRARVTQIMNLLKLPAEMREFLAGLENPKEIRKYSERRLRKGLKSKTR